MYIFHNYAWKAKSAVEKRKSFGALLTDLSKASDRFSQERLLPSIHAYEFTVVLRLIHSYFTNRRQRTKIKVMNFLRRNCIWDTTRVYSRTFVVQHFSVTFFFIMKGIDFSSSRDNNTPHRTADTVDEVIKLLERGSKMLLKCFSNNQMKVNIRKRHFLVNKKDEVAINIRETKIQFN